VAPAPGHVSRGERFERSVVAKERSDHTASLHPSVLFFSGRGSDMLYEPEEEIDVRLVVFLLLAWRARMLLPSECHKFSF
jgi:hypothetical protein